MPPRRAVELRVGGQTYRVVATGDDHSVQQLAELVDRKFTEVVPHGLGRNVTAQQAMFLTAMALAAEVEEQRSRATLLEVERDRSLHLATRAKEVVGRLLQRVDTALSGATPAPAPVSTPTSVEARPPPSRQPVATDHKRPASEPRGPFLDTSSPLDPLTDPPDAIHESLLIDLVLPPPHDVRQSLPHDVRQSLPRDVRQSLPHDVRQSRRPAIPPARRPARNLGSHE